MNAWLYTDPDGVIARGEWSDDALATSFTDAMG